MYRYGYVNVHKRRKCSSRPRRRTGPGWRCARSDPGPGPAGGSPRGPDDAQGPAQVKLGCPDLGQPARGQVTGDGQFADNRGRRAGQHGRADRRGGGNRQRGGSLGVARAEGGGQRRGQRVPGPRAAFPVTRGAAASSAALIPLRRRLQGWPGATTTASRSWPMTRLRSRAGRRGPSIKPRSAVPSVTWPMTVSELTAVSTTSRATPPGGRPRPGTTPARPAAAARRWSSWS